MPLHRETARTRLIGLFLLALALFMPPLVMLPGSGNVLGIPALYAYLFGGWALLIAGLAWTIERRSGRPPHDGA